jgi:hypothetical protein
MLEIKRIRRSRYGFDMKSEAQPCVNARSCSLVTRSSNPFAAMVMGRQAPQDTIRSETGLLTYLSSRADLKASTLGAAPEFMRAVESNESTSYFDATDEEDLSVTQARKMPLGSRGSGAS